MAAAALAYVVARAAAVSFSYDEAYSYFHFVGAPIRTVVFFDGEVTANNHSLNSLLMTLTSRFFGTSELALRLPNVLAFVGYAAAVVAVGSSFRNRIAAMLLSVMLLLNPFVLELFSLARGYGLALAFVFGSLAFLAAALPEESEVRASRRLTAATALAAGSVFASLPFLNFFLPFLAVVVVSRLRFRPNGANSTRFRSLRTIWFLASSSIVWLAVVGLYAVPAIWILRKRGELYYGGQTGFWRDTVDSLIRCWLYIEPYGAAVKPVVWALVLLTLAIGIVISAIPRTAGASPAATDLLRALIAILGLAALASVVQHLRFGTPFLINRTASWMLPCFLLVLALEVEIALTSRHVALRRLTFAGGCLLLVACLLHAAFAANLRYAILQYHDADTKQMLRDLDRLVGKTEQGRNGVILLSSWELAPSIEYYRVTRPLKWLRSVWLADFTCDGSPCSGSVDPKQGQQTETLQPADIAFLSPKDFEKLGTLVRWKEYPITGNVLALREGLIPGVGTSGSAKSQRKTR